MTRSLYKLGVAAARRPWRMIAIWLIAAAAVFGANATWGGEFEDKFENPGADSQQAADALEERFPEFRATTARLVFHSDDGFAAPEAREAVAGAVERAEGAPHVAFVTDPFDPAAPAVSEDGTIAFAVVNMDNGDGSSLPGHTADDLEEAVEPGEHGPVTVEMGGELIDNRPEEPSGAETIGLAVAVVVLIVALGSVVAMSLPIGLALLALSAGLGGLGIMAGFLDTPEMTPTVAQMIGLGVGIDYCLFVLTRHRAFMAEGKSVAESAGRANATSGQAVLFAGMTVVVAICGLQLSGLPAIAALGYGTAIVVAASVLGAITLLPAFLGLVGHRIDGLRARTRAKKKEHVVDPDATMAGRWAARVGEKPVRYAVASFVLLVALAAPVLSLRIGFADAGADPEGQTNRQAYDLLEEGFGPGFNGPLLLSVDLEGAEPGAAEAVAAAVAADDGIAAVGAPIVNQAGDTAVIQAVPTTSPQDEATPDTVRRIRADVLPAAEEATGATVDVGGPTAVLVDMSEKVTSRLPIFIAAVVLLSFVLLTLVFRSVVVPAKAAVMNMLSIGASYGFIVAMFQWGWGKGLLGLEETIPINPFVPMMMFAILFGLSMDYEVFLLSRIREEYVRTRDNHESVVHGLAGTARVITSAAIIMVSVFAAFVLSPDPTVKMIGLGLAVAVFLDATVVRMILVPATMALMGNGNWWVPRWLDRILPHVDIEGGSALDPVEDEEADDDEASDVTTDEPVEQAA
jgi:RND superfamily putative drug exporter